MTDPIPRFDPGLALQDALAQCGAAIPNRLFTAMRFHPDTMEVERIHSTMPQAYPVSGRKPKRRTEWGQKVLIDRQVNAGFGEDDIAWAFDDHDKILALGLRAVLNVPVIAGDRVIGTLNYLREGPAFTAAEIATARACADALSQRGAL